MNWLKVFWTWLKSLLPKSKRVPATIGPPKIVIPPLEPKKAKPVKVAKEFIRPEDPDYRYGSRHLIDLREQRGLTSPITKFKPRKIG